MVFRKATINDIDRIAKNRIEFMDELGVSVDKKQFYICTEQFLKKHIADDTALAWLAVENDEIISIAILSIYEVLPTGTNISGKTGLLLNVGTAEKYRKQGIMTKLLNMLIDNAKQLGVGEIVLNATEMGKPVYAKLGFKEHLNEMVLFL